MKRNFFTLFFLALAFTLSGCKHERVPDNLIDTATMRAILTEYYLIDGYDYVVASRYKDSLGFQSKAAKDSMLSRYHISQADYDSSLSYYVRHPKEFEQILDRAILAINELSSNEKK